MERDAPPQTAVDARTGNCRSTERDIMAEVGPLDPTVLQNVAHEAALSDFELDFIRRMASAETYFTDYISFLIAEDRMDQIVETATRNANAFLDYVYAVEHMRSRERMIRLIVDPPRLA